MRVKLFKPEFEPLILSGAKKQTIRPAAKRPLRVGEQISMRVWTGAPYRSKQREFATATVAGVFPVELIFQPAPGADSASIFCSDGLALGQFEVTQSRDYFARKDGVESWEKLREHFLHYYSKGRLPFVFRGELIKWCALIPEGNA